MMWILLGLCLIFSTVFASPSCKVARWQNWSECQPTRKCDQSIRKSYAFPGVSSEVDHGRVRMERMMKDKIAHWEVIRQCRKDGTCPEYEIGDSSGPADCIDGTAGPVDGRSYPCDNIDLVYFIDIEDMSGGEADEGNDIWGWTDPETGDEYVMMGLNYGVSFVRITDPEDPVIVAYLSTRTGPSLWRDIKIVNNHAFIVSEAPGHGMQVYDLTQLRDSNGFQVVEATAEFDDFGNAHNIVSNEDTEFVYVVGATQDYPGYTCGGGLLAIDVSDPTSPTFAGCYGDDGYTHDAQCIVYAGPDTEHQQKEICFAFNEDTLTIVDVTDKDDMFYISRTGYDNAAYTHQGWVTEDHTTVLLDDELDELGGSRYTITYLWDVSDLDNPELKNSYTATTPVPDHNQYIKEDRVYQSNYQAGLRILEIDQDSYDLTELAYFDVFPVADSLMFSGTWSNYPYFSSGIIPVSSMEYGLFLLRVNENGIQQTLKTKSFGHQYRSSIADKTCGTKQQQRSCVPSDICQH